ncbi:SpoIIE family protein phosphatase [Nocardiopsis sp. NPDC050513]|uniref:SpoIIE family protein phosphatase n=1 Tax=Nocardiopsis sp. NPDC050513 TaxID=3364338 RepID=UPI003796BB75
MTQHLASESPPDNALARMRTTVATIDGRGVLTGWSEGARDLLGYPGEEVLGRSATALLTEDSPRVDGRLLERKPTWMGRVVLRHRDGHRVEGELLANRRMTPEGTGWILVWNAVRRVCAVDTVVAWGFDQAPCLLAVLDTDLRVLRANADMERAVGLTADQMRGLRAPECLPHPETEKYELLMRRVLETGERLQRDSVMRVPGEERTHAWRITVAPVRDEIGRIRGVCFAARDTTEEVASRRRLLLLNEAGLRIGTTLDVTRTADELAEVGTDHFADFVVVDLLDSVLRGEDIERAPSGDQMVFRRVAQRSVLPGCPEAVVTVGTVHSYGRDAPAGHALTDGRAVLQRFDEATLRLWERTDPERARSTRDHGVNSVLIVPLCARGVPLGLAFFCRHRTPEPFDDQDLRLAEELATRAAVYVDNARRYTHERATALALQHSLLPRHAPPLTAVEVATRYLPASSRAGIGGDWFDVIPLSGARVALVVGDVVGHGLHASATMGRLRMAVRTLADVDLPPDELLTQLDDLVLCLEQEETEDGAEPRPGGTVMGATCLYAVYDPVSRRCSMAGAGHPPPVLTTPEGEADLLDLPTGPPLGLGGLPFEVADFELPERSLLTLYTNGLIETRERDLGDALDQLRSVLSRPDRALEETCDMALSTLSPDRRVDDVALLVARTRAMDADQVATWDVPNDPAAVPRIRQSVCDRLATWGLEGVAFIVELVVSELVTNAIRYGRPPVRLRLIRDTSLVCEVSDASATAPHLRRARVFDEGGRGLFIVAQLTQRWGCRHERERKTIWAETPLRAAFP